MDLFLEQKIDDQYTKKRKPNQKSIQQSIQKSETKPTIKFPKQSFKINKSQIFPIHKFKTKQKPQKQNSVSTQTPSSEYLNCISTQTEITYNSLDNKFMAHSEDTIQKVNNYDDTIDVINQDSEQREDTHLSKYLMEMADRDDLGGEVGQIIDEEGEIIS